MAFRHRLIFAAAAFLFIPQFAAAQLDEEDYPPGLLARYTAGGKNVERIDADLSFVWDEDAPDVRLPPGPFSATWQSNLLVRREGQFRFHAYLTGKVRVMLDDQPVLQASRKTPGWVHGQEVELSFGETPLAVEFTRTGKTARLQLFWSSDSFSLEPIPGHLLFRDEGSPELAMIERGRLAFDAHRCNRCHVRNNDPPSPPAPSLTHAAAGLSHERLIQQIQHPAKASPHARMPSFGFDDRQAKAVAAFLLSQSKPVKLEPPGAVKEQDRQKERRAGHVLLRSVGCLACHTVGREGQSGPHGGGDLSGAGAKRSAAWLNTWLSDPAKLNADHRMPDMKLSVAERRQIVSFLATSSPAAASSRAADDEPVIAEGRKLFEAARCTACHRIEGIESNVGNIPDLSQPIGDGEKSCLAEKPDLKTGRPSYSQIDRDAVKAYVESRVGALSPPSQFAQGRQVLERRNCLACHPRGGERGIVDVAGRMAQIDPALKGKSQGLIPPALNAVGDKLLDEALIKAVNGEQKPRLTWLMVRMPRFRHGKQEQRDLVSYLIGHDRIPDGGPSSPAIAQESSTAQTLVSGQTLIGPKGFSCIACHHVGSYVPRNVALGTRGSDLMLLGKRMRRDFYVRWTRSPARIVPGMEMPSYVKPVPNVLEGDIDRQLIATWDALNDPKFKPPTNPSAVEQFWVVRPGEPARIVRDVFTVSQENGGGYVPRALAIGLNNGHNLLFDLDTFTLRSWWFGDFARQRTQGKSWFWDAAGVPVVSGFGRESDFALLPKGKRGEQPIFPKLEHGTNGTLLNYHADGDGVVLKYAMPFEIDGEVQRLLLAESIQPDENGWTREVRVAAAGGKLSGNFHLVIARPTKQASASSASIDATQDSEEEWIRFPQIERREFLKITRGSAGAAAGPPHLAVKLHYTSSLKPEPAELKLKPADPPQIEQVTSVPGFDGIRLPVSRAIMPTAMTFTRDGKLAFTSLKGHVYIAEDGDGDGIQDRLNLFEEGLAAPFGIIADGDDLIVAHKPEVLRLHDSDGDGRADSREVVATGWGYNDNYHDWTCGIVRDKEGNLYVGLGSDYAQKNRPKEQSRWRGAVLQIGPGRKITPLGHAFRYPTGLAIDADDNIFVSDNQGVQNTFNEINHLVPGKHYGVPSRHEPNPDAEATPPAIQVPHPWTRSVNGLFFLKRPSFPRSRVGTSAFDSPRRDGAREAERPRLRSHAERGNEENGGAEKLQAAGGIRPPLALLAGHGIGCEYDSRFMVRFTTQKVQGVMQGAVYYFSKPNAGAGGTNFVGPMCGTVAPNGDIYIGSITDSGWSGGRNTGAITRLRPNGKLPNGIRELRATPDGFEIEFLKKIDRTAAMEPDGYSISGYTRKWKGSYATPDSDRHRAKVTSVDVLEDGRTVRLKVNGLREGFVYEVSSGRIGGDPETPLFPATGHYTLHRIPQ